MQTLNQKLNLKDQRELLLLQVPDSLHQSLQDKQRTIFTHPDRIQSICFLVAYVLKAEDIGRLVASIAQKLCQDPVVWFAYPKKSSKLRILGLDRDTGWQPLGDLGFEAVRQISIDEDYSAIRFRKTTFIKTLNRKSGVMSEAGKKRSK